MINYVNPFVRDDKLNKTWIFNEHAWWTAAVHVDVAVITAPCQGPWSVILGPGHCTTSAQYVGVCVFECLSESFSLLLFFRALLCELHGVGASYLFLLQRDGHGVSSSREGAFFVCFFLTLSLSSSSFDYPFIIFNLACFIPGDGVPCGSRVQSRPGWLSACPWKTVDHIPKGTAQLLRPGRFTLLL